MWLLVHIVHNRHELTPWACPGVWAARGAGAAQWAEVGPVARMYVTVSGMPGGSGERGRGGGEGEDGIPMRAVYNASQDGGYLIAGCRADDAASSGCGECVACVRG